MTEIKPYEPMGYVYTFGDEPKIYHLPMEKVEMVMGVVNSENPPKILDLRKYGYGRESVSMIRGAKEIGKDEGDVERFILQQPVEIMEEMRLLIKSRRKSHLKVTVPVLEAYLSEKS